MATAEASHSLESKWADVPVRQEKPRRRMRLSDCASVTMEPWDHSGRYDFTLTCNITEDDDTSPHESLLRLLAATEDAARSLRKIIEESK